MVERCCCWPGRPFVRLVVRQKLDNFALIAGVVKASKSRTKVEGTRGLRRMMSDKVGFDGKSRTVSESIFRNRARRLRAILF